MSQRKWDVAPYHRYLDEKQYASCVQLATHEHAHEREKALLATQLQNWIKGFKPETEATDDVS
jgi:hypothetical protein